MLLALLIRQRYALLLIKLGCEVGEHLCHVIDPMLQIGVPVVLAVVVRPAEERLGDAGPSRLEDTPTQVKNPVLYSVPLSLDLIGI